MPLRACDRQPLIPHSVNKSKLTASSKVFYCETTNEIFQDYEDYCNRLLELDEKNWMCAISFRKGLSYYEAQISEEKLAARVAQLPVPIHRALCCLVANFGLARVDKLTEGCYDFLKTRFLIGEPILYESRAGQGDHNIVSIRVDDSKPQNGGMQIDTDSSESDTDIPLSLIKAAGIKNGWRQKSYQKKDREVYYMLSNGEEVLPHQIRRPTAKNNSGSYLSKDVIKFWVRCCCDFDHELNYTLKDALRDKALQMDFYSECHPVDTVPCFESPPVSSVTTTTPTTILPLKRKSSSVLSPSLLYQNLPNSNNFEVTDIKRQSYNHSPVDTPTNAKQKEPEILISPTKPKLTEPTTYADAKTYCNEWINYSRETFNYTMKTHKNSSSKVKEDVFKIAKTTMLNDINEHKNILRQFELRERQLKLEEERSKRNERMKSRPQMLENMRLWANAIEDLEIVQESSKLIKPVPISSFNLTLTDSIDFSAIISIYEFFNSTLFDQIVEDIIEREEFPSLLHETKFIKSLPVNYNDLEQGLITSNPESILTDILFALLPLVLYQQKVELEEYSTKTQSIAVANSSTILWASNSLSLEFHQIPIDSVSITEMIRLYFIAYASTGKNESSSDDSGIAHENGDQQKPSDGGNLDESADMDDDEVEEQDEADEKPAEIEEDVNTVALDFCLHKAHILKALEFSTVFDLEPRDKLDIITALINVVLYDRREFVTSLMDKLIENMLMIDEYKDTEKRRGIEFRRARKKIEREIKVIKDQQIKLQKEKEKAMVEKAAVEKLEVKTEENSEVKQENGEEKLSNTEHRDSPVLNESVETIAGLERDIADLETEDIEAKKKHQQTLIDVHREYFRLQRVSKITPLGMDRFRRRYYNISNNIFVQEDHSSELFGLQESVVQKSKDELKVEFPTWITRSDYPAEYLWVYDTKLQQQKILEPPRPSITISTPSTPTKLPLTPTKPETHSPAEQPSPYLENVESPGVFSTTPSIDPPDSTKSEQTDEPRAEPEPDQFWPNDSFSGQVPTWYTFPSKLQVVKLLAGLNVRGTRERKLYKAIKHWLEYNEFQNSDTIFKTTDNTRIASPINTQNSTTYEVLRFDITKLEREVNDAGLTKPDDKKGIKTNGSTITNGVMHQSENFDEIQSYVHFPDDNNHADKTTDDPTMRDLKQALITVARSIPTRFCVKPFGTAPCRRVAKRPKHSLLPNKQTRDECQAHRRRWEESVKSCKSLSQLSLHISAFNMHIAWDYSVKKAKCQDCKAVGQADQLLFCDLCNLAHHTYCLSPKLNEVPEGDWFCPECGGHKGLKIEPLKINRKSFIPVCSKDIIKEFMKHDLAWPFLKPVTKAIAPQYHLIIKSPMDLGTIKKRFDKSMYEDVGELCDDVRLMFCNCYTYNETGSEIYQTALELEEYFVDKLLKSHGLDGCYSYKDLS